jgi:hypothetical protein
MSGQLVSRFTVVIHDRGPAPKPPGDRGLSGPRARFEAEVVGFAIVREAGISPWDAVSRLVANHRPLLERRWSSGVRGS